MSGSASRERPCSPPSREREHMNLWFAPRLLIPAGLLILAYAVLR